MESSHQNIAPNLMIRTAGQRPRDHDLWLSWTTAVKPGNHQCMHCALYRAMRCIARTMLSQDVCLSVCLSHAGILSQRFSVSTQSGRHTILIIAAPNVMAIFRRRLSNRGVKCGAGMQKSRFSTNVSLSEMIKDTAILTIKDE